MKRIAAACICQTLHFMLKDDIGPKLTEERIREEVEAYKASLERKHTRYKILEEHTEPDGSMFLKIIKQYNESPVGTYLD